MPLVTCPVCGKKFDPAKSSSPPFCNDRCRLIDLKRWLGEEYAVPHIADDPDEEGETPPRSNEES